MENYPNLANATDLPDRDLEIVIFNGTPTVADCAIQQTLSKDAEQLDYLLRCRNNFRNAMGIAGSRFSSKH